MTRDHVPNEAAYARVERDILMHWKRLQAEIDEVQEDAAALAFSQGSGDPVQSSNLSDKTARGAAMLETIAEKRRWLEVVTEAMDWMKEEKPEWYRLLYGHYGMKYTRGYRRKYARIFTDDYCRVMIMDRESYRKRRIKAIDEIVGFARDAGLLRDCKQFNQWLNVKKP